QDTFSPASNLFVLGYSVGREATKPLENEESRAWNVAAAGSKAITENPMYQGLDRFSQINRPGGIQRFSTDSASMVVPTAVSDLGSAFDDTRRESRKQPGDSFGDVLVKSIQRRVPGWRNSLPPRVNALGDVETESLKNIIDPTFMQDARWQQDKALGE